MNNKLKLLSKKELIEIISKMKKEELIKIIEGKKGGSDVTREPIIFDIKKKESKNITNNIAMQNDKLYNNIYI
jgi:hypothetical protein